MDRQGWSRPLSLRRATLRRRAEYCGLPLPEKASPKSQNILIAKRGNDVAFLPENADYYWQETGNWYKKVEADTLVWSVFDDRNLYKPREEVAVKGYIRKKTAGKLGDITSLGDAARGLTYSVKDSRNNEIAKGTAQLNAFGAFDLKFKLPDNANLGNAANRLYYDDQFSRIDVRSRIPDRGISQSGV